MTEASARFALPFLMPGQAQKEVFHNEALAGIDCALHASVEGAPLADPPSSPEIGESWIVAAGATGAWAGRTDALAVWTSGGWRFAAPVAGMTAWDKAEGHWLHWSGSDWLAEWPVSRLTVGGLQVVGERLPDVPSPSGGTIIDDEARSAIAQLIATLKSHGLIE